MFFLDLTLPTLAANLALDEALLLDAEIGGPALLRVWDWPEYAVVMGAGSLLSEDVDEAACRADGISVCRRSSGGGTVLLGPGCLLFSLILPFDHHPALREIKTSYRHVLGEMGKALAELAPGLAHAGISDLAAEDRKCSGNAQQRKRAHLLHHGTLLYAFDLGRLPRYLKQPARQPGYRKDRDHLAFLMNLPGAREDLIRRMRERWQALEPTAHWPRAKVRELVDEKYGREEWTRRR